LYEKNLISDAAEKGRRAILPLAFTRAADLVGLLR
jgi:hypothetical protein